MLIKNGFILLILSISWTYAEYEELDDPKGRMTIYSDYYFGNVKLRNEELMNCNKELHVIYCRYKCGKRPGVCLQNKCYCVLIVPSVSELPKLVSKPKTVQIINKQMTPMVPIEESLEEDDDFNEGDLALALRPTVRHHIAHFCPNLDIARDCIRKCMKMGRPAFCAKDHVCYCGHRYDKKTDKAHGPSAKEQYAQFRDLYIKYLGYDPYDKKDQKQEESEDQVNVAHNVESSEEPPDDDNNVERASKKKSSKKTKKVEKKTTKSVKKGKRIRSG